MTEKEKEIRDSKREIREAIVAGTCAFVCSASASALACYAVSTLDVSQAPTIVKIAKGPAKLGVGIASGQIVGDAVDRKVRNVFQLFYAIDELIPEGEEVDVDETEEEQKTSKKKK